MLKEHRSVDGAWELIKTAPDVVLLGTAPLFATNSNFARGERHSIHILVYKSNFHLRVHLVSDIDLLDYFIIDCYADVNSLTHNSSLLVVRKPRTVSS